MTRFTIITAFPEFFNDFLSASIIGRGVKAGLCKVDVVDLRSFGRGAYRQVDDYSFGSGGMVLMAKPLEEALNSVEGGAKGAFVVYPTPQGVPLTQETVETLFRQPHVVIVCGHYEGVDERFVERCVDLEVTIGDCVLTGGEIPAMAVIDAVCRLIPGVVGKENAVVEDSFYKGMLDHPHYTRPASWNKMDVPEVLLSGHAAKILEWRRGQAVVRTVSRRPDLLLKSSLRGYISGGIYVSFVYSGEYAVDWLKDAVSLCESYGVARLLLIAEFFEEKERLRQVIKAENCESLSKVKLISSLVQALEWVGHVTVVYVCDEAREGAMHWLEVKRLILEKGEPVLFHFLRRDESTPEEETSGRIVTMLPLEEGRLSFRGKFAVVLDRFLGSK